MQKCEDNSLNWYLRLTLLLPCPFVDEKCLVSSRATKIRTQLFGNTMPHVEPFQSGLEVLCQRVTGIAAFSLSNCRSPCVWERQLGTGTNCPPSCSLVPVTILEAFAFSIPHLKQAGRSRNCTASNERRDSTY